VVHGLDHEREADRPVVTPAGDQPDANGIAPGHQPVAVVLDLVNPVGAGRGLVGGGRKAGLDEGGSTQHGAYLVGGREESNLQERNTARRIGEMPRPAPCYPSAEDKPRSAPSWRGFPYLEPAKKMTEY
jgi:hypothetical protein